MKATEFLNKMPFANKTVAEKIIQQQRERQKVQPHQAYSPQWVDVPTDEAQSAWVTIDDTPKEPRTCHDSFHSIEHQCGVNMLHLFFIWRED